MIVRLKPWRRFSHELLWSCTPILYFLAQLSSLECGFSTPVLWVFISWTTFTPNEKRDHGSLLHFTDISWEITKKKKKIPRIQWTSFLSTFETVCFNGFKVPEITTEWWMERIPTKQMHWTHLSTHTHTLSLSDSIYTFRHYYRKAYRINHQTQWSKRRINVSCVCYTVVYVLHLIFNRKCLLHGDAEGDDCLTFQSAEGFLSWRDANWPGLGMFCPGRRGVGIQPKIPKLEAVAPGKAAGKKPGYCAGLKIPLWRFDEVLTVAAAGEEEAREVTWIQVGSDFLWPWIRWRREGPDDSVLKSKQLSLTVYTKEYWEWNVRVLLKFGWIFFALHC